MKKPLNEIRYPRYENMTYDELVAELARLTEASRVLAQLEELVASAVKRIDDENK